MSLDILRSNIQQEKTLLERLKVLSGKYQTIDDKQKKMFDDVIRADKNQIKILNDSVPDLLNNISIIKKLDNSEIKEDKNIISVSHTATGSNVLVGINKRDKNNYLQQLNISDSALKSLKKKRLIKEDFGDQFKKASFYTQISNKFFSKFSRKLIDKGYFSDLGNVIRKAEFMVLLNSYVSISFFSAFLALILALFLFLFFLFFNVILDAPFIVINSDILTRFLEIVWIIPILPAATFAVFYFYPYLEKSSVEKDIDYELPFVTIQMAAIAGADIEPSNIFKIIALSKEYPNIKRESKKIMNQINLYGYDLVNALRNVALASPSKEWAELLNGFSTTIVSGGDLSEYLQKRADTLLFEYRLKREKATKSAETFMDIYISVVIAAPMLMMLLLIMLNISQIGFQIPISLLTISVVSIISLINIIFLVFLHLNQKRI